MEFLKSLVPGGMSGEGPVDHGGGLARDTGPRLLRIKRLGLLAMGQTTEEYPVVPIVDVDPGLGSSKPVRWNRNPLKGTTGSAAQGCSRHLL
ncbi:hypothetical protein VZT92_021687 [Zoarces viviparus]|uniref:Uncharacterized protein n=1 Tax=Zoarces viviparus TaxID=48416 RepID=A0AAW1E8S8_ZOAVI